MQITEAPAALEPTEASEVSLRDVLDILFRRRIVILVFILAGLAIAAALMLRPRRYTATGTIRVQPGTASMYRTSPAALLSGEESDKIASEAEIAQSRTLYLQVARELDLVNNPAFWGKSHLKHQSLDDPKTREKLIRLMQKEVGVSHNPKDELIHFSCTTISPALSAKIVNALINDYISNLFRMRYGSTKRVSGWLIGQLDDLKQQIQNDQTEIISLQKKLGVIGLNEQNAEYLQTQSLNAITKAATDATVERILAEAKLRNLQESDPNLMEGEVNLLTQGPGASVQNSLLQNLRNAQAQAASSYSRLLAQFGPNYPEVRQQKAQLDEISNEVKTEQRRILNQAKVSYDAAKANESMDTNLLHQKTGEAFSSGGDMVRYVLLLHDYESHRSLYEELVQRLREAGITSGLEAGEIDVVDLADLPAIPNPPGPLLLAAGGLFLGFFGGCFLALAVEALETKVTNLEQAERASTLPLLGQVPHADLVKGISNSGPSRSGLVAPGTQYAESLQTVRTSMLLGRPGRPPKIILVTSAVPAEGKSTTARNLANTFATHHSKVLLIECDLRRGMQGLALGLSSAVGVTNVLIGQATLDRAVQPVAGHENLSVLLSGPRPPNPAVLVGSPQMEQLIQQCAQQYDFVILDSAPVLAISDTLNLGRLADAVIFVVREGESHRRAVRDAVARMQGARLPLVGFVLNDVDFQAHSYSYGYGYGKPYDQYFGNEDGGGE